MSRLVPVDPDRPDPAILAEAAAILRAGGLVAFATETVYGLGADATNPDAVTRIFAAKGRPATNPLIVHVDRVDSARSIVASWPGRADLLAGRFWPGPLTLILPHSGQVPAIVTAGQGTVGVRVPEPLVARELIRLSGVPVAAPSANRSTGVSPTRAEHVHADLDGKLDLILDSGPTRVGIESTVLDLSGDVPRVLRPGAITADQIAAVLGEPVTSADHALDASAPMASPGQMSIHYAPRTPAYRVERDQLAGGTLGAVPVVWFGPRDGGFPARPTDLIHLDPPGIAANRLYQTLRDLDAGGHTHLVVVMPPDRPEWAAIRDRLRRATRPWDGRGPLP